MTALISETKYYEPVNFINWSIVVNKNIDSYVKSTL